MKQGFTWLELLLATTVAALFLALAQGPFLQLSSLLNSQQTSLSQRRQLDRFLLMLKTELVQAGYALGEGATPVQFVEDELRLQADLNRDGDLGDTREQIAYRFQDDAQALQRRSGGGSFQTLLEGVHQVSFSEGPSRLRPGIPKQQCVIVRLQLQRESTPEDYTLCPLFL